jgi:6-pyruvoyltetrahydropterin/6-carboxytetrahydropterin synthase
MYRLSVADYFSSAHQLKGYKGKCETLHGHNWKVVAEVEGSDLNDIGLLVDFKDLKGILKDVLDRLDHVCLNDIEEFRESNPSSELIARYIHGQIKERLPAGIRIVNVKVWESERARAEYYE